jgi:hypothetical protein
VITTALLLPLLLMLVQGILGAIDTLVYHEWQYRLTGHPEHCAQELALHGARDLIYGLLFFTLPTWAWQGALAGVLVLLLAAEIGITLVDFVVERRVRQPWGGLAAGELAMHTVMAIVYGAFLVTLAPHLLAWFAAPTGLTPHTEPVHAWLQGLAALMGTGVILAGLRDLAVARGSLALRWPWGREPRLGTPPTDR